MFPKPKARWVQRICPNAVGDFFQSFKTISSTEHLDDQEHEDSKTQ